MTEDTIQDARPKFMSREFNPNQFPVSQSVPVQSRTPQEAMPAGTPKDSDQCETSEQVVWTDGPINLQLPKMNAGDMYNVVGPGGTASAGVAIASTQALQETFTLTDRQRLFNQQVEDFHKEVARQKEVNRLNAEMTKAECEERIAKVERQCAETFDKCLEQCNELCDNTKKELQVMIPNSTWYNITAFVLIIVVGGWLTVFSLKAAWYGYWWVFTW